MQTKYYIGLDVHKRTISYCVKDGSGAIHAQGAIPATRFDLDRWMKTLPQPWTVDGKPRISLDGSTITSVIADTQTHLFVSECDWSISLIARLSRAYLL
jgi:hypothetical protein